MASSTSACLCLAALGLAGCGRLSSTPSGSGGDTGTTGDDGSVASEAGGSDATEPTSDAAAEADVSDGCSASLAGARIVLLTDDQYVNAVRDVFGVDLVVSTQPPGRTASPLYNEDVLVDVAKVSAYHQASRVVASKLAPCGGTPDATCMETFVRSKLPLAWRRPVTDNEIAGIMALFNAGLMISTDRALEVAISAMLDSGSFLYRTEIGKDAASSGAKSIALTAHELASAVSFAFLDTVPDAELRAKADDGTLLDPSVLGVEADRLLASPQVRDRLRQRVSKFLDMETLNSPYLFPKSPTQFPSLTPAVQSALYQGGQLFLDDVLWRGHFQDLFSSHRVYMNADLAGIYGIDGVKGSDLGAVDVTDGFRNAGVFTQPAYLASTNHHPADDDVVHRGLAIYRAFVCGPPIGTPPANEDTVFASIPGSTIRDRWTAVDQTACGQCHSSFDALGIATLSYDAIGRFRKAYWDTMLPVDTAVTLKGLGMDLDGPVAGIDDLAKRLSGARTAECATYRLIQMTVETGSGSIDNCSLAPIRDELTKKGTFSTFFKAIVTSPAFLTRDLGAP
jgi:hypothetical protein